jgi:hypothetical protein
LIRYGQGLSNLILPGQRALFFASITPIQDRYEYSGLAVDDRARPLALVATAGHHGDSPQFVPVLKRVRPRGLFDRDASSLQIMKTPASSSRERHTDTH